MATKLAMKPAIKTRPRTAPAPFDSGSVQDLLLTPPVTLEDHLLRIQVLGKRVTEYVQFMAAIEKVSGTSPEAKQKAVAVFYERLLVLERVLGRIQEELQLG